MEGDRFDRIARFYDIKKTELELVKDRGYSTTEDEENGIILNDEDEELYFDNFIDYLTKVRNNNPLDEQYWIDRGVYIDDIDNWDIILDNLQTLAAKLDKYKIEGDEHRLLWHNYWNEDFTKCLLIYHVYQQRGGQTSKDSVTTFDLLLQNMKKITVAGNLVEISSILVVTDPPSTDANKMLNNLQHFQLFFESELTYNPTQHIDNQRHVLIPKEEVKPLLEKLKVDKSKLPIARLNDETVKYYGWTVGDMIKIYRTDRHVSILSPKSLNYRVVTV